MITSNTHLISPAVNLSYDVGVSQWIMSCHKKCYDHMLHNTFGGEALWPSGRASDFGARGRGSILTQVTVLYP